MEKAKKGASFSPSFDEELKVSENLDKYLVAGVDEAGRGPLVGRVYAAAVILPYLPDNEVIMALNDSKKLSAKKREELYDKIKEVAISYATAYCEVEEIEEYNILNASLLAMRRAVKQLSSSPSYLLIDGNVNKGFEIPSKSIVSGDAKSVSIAAASILAKVERDRYCDNVLDKEYPQYNFAKHKGYGTKAHYEAIEKFGICPYHRKSFLKKFKNGIYSN